MAKGMQIKGAGKLLATLAKLEKKVAIAANRKATRAGATAIGRIVKAAVPVDEGLLKRTETVKVTNKGFSATGIIGSDQDKLNADAAADHSRPTNQDWLVEYGHTTPDGVFVPPSGYMRRAAADAMPIGEAKYISVLKAAIEGAV